jgi:hypothetical protein
MPYEECLKSLRTCQYETPVLRQLLRQRELAIIRRQPLSAHLSHIFSSETTTRYNELQAKLLNGYSLMGDTWPMDARRGAALDSRAR